MSLRNSAAFWACTITGTVALFAGTTSFIAARNLFDARVFGQRAERSLADPGVATYVSTLVADAVIKSRPDLIAVRPILEASARGLVSARPFQVLVGAAAQAGSRSGILGGWAARGSLDSRPADSGPRHAGTGQPGAGGEDSQTAEYDPGFAGRRQPGTIPDRPVALGQQAAMDLESASAARPGVAGGGAVGGER